MTSSRESTLELCVIAEQGCAAADAYLKYMHRAGLRPRKILVTGFSGSGTGTLLLRKLFGRRFANRLLLVRWLRQFRNPNLREICSSVQQQFAFELDWPAPTDYSRYAADVEHCPAFDFFNPLSQELLRDQPCQTFLYTCGGRVPKGILDMKGIRFLHIHPGVLPQVRGSDGLLWSLLLRGSAGASCFFMSPGLDTGALVATREFGRPHLSLPPASLDTNLLYQALTHCYDPHLRGLLLVQVLTELLPTLDLRDLPSAPQPNGQGHTYLRMHRDLRDRVLRALVAGAPLPPAGLAAC